MSTRSPFHRLWVLVLLGVFLTFFAVSVSLAARDNAVPLQQASTPTPVRAGPAMIVRNGPILFDFPAPRPLSSAGPIDAPKLSDLEKSSLAVVKLFGCLEATEDVCSLSEGSGTIIHPRGLILTALHVVIKDPNNLSSSILPEISVEMLEKPDGLVESRYRAKVAAIEPNLDLALLWLISPVGEPDAYLPTLPVENISNQEFKTGNLEVMGFGQGQRRLKTPSVKWYGQNDDGAIELDGPLVKNGFSGSPLLVQRNDRYHVGGVVFYRTDGPILIQPMQRIKSLRWLIPPTSQDIWQLWAEDVQINSFALGGQVGLMLSTNVYAIDLTNQRLRIEAWAYYPDNDQPWPSADDHFSLRRTFSPSRFVDAIPLELDASLSDLEPVPDGLLFELQILDVDESRLLWKGEAHYRRPENLPTATNTPTGISAPTSTPTRTPVLTPTYTSTPTRTPTVTDTPTPIRTKTAGRTPTRPAVVTPRREFTSSPTPLPTATTIATDASMNIPSNQNGVTVNGKLHFVDGTGNQVNISEISELYLFLSQSDVQGSLIDGCTKLILIDDPNFSQSGSFKITLPVGSYANGNYTVRVQGITGISDYFSALAITEEEQTILINLQPDNIESFEGFVIVEPIVTSCTGDIEACKLKRLIDHRASTFALLRQVIDCYNETAKNIIQSMRD